MGERRDEDVCAWCGDYRRSHTDGIGPCQLCKWNHPPGMEPCAKFKEAIQETFAEKCAAVDMCPKCGGELDTGWECNLCGYDAMPHVAE